MPEIDQETSSEAVNNVARARRLRIAAVALLAVCLAGFIYWWVFVRNFVSTDDAYAKADSAQISTRVPGTVARVLVENDFAVSAGDPLIELDPADYKVAVDRARAVLDEDEAELRGAEITLPPVDVQTSSGIQAAEAALKASQDTEQQTRHTLGQLKASRAATEADFKQAERDYRRYDNLSKAGAGTERQFEQARTVFERTKAMLSSVDAQIAALESALAASIQQVVRAKAQLRSTSSQRANVEVQAQKVEALRAKRDKSRADLEAALLRLSYCTIGAPISGYVAQKNIQIGDRVQPVQALMAVVPLGKIYVEANYKETQLTDVRIGQPATISADIYPGFEYKGRVSGIRAGTGAAFSLIPPENATGNWIKVVQRIPVRIDLDQPPPPDRPLRVGASLYVTVNIADRRGPQLVEDKRASRPSSLPVRP